MDIYFLSLMFLKVALAQSYLVPNYTLYEITAFNYRERAFLYWHHIKNDDLVFINGVTNKASQTMSVAVHECCIAPFEETLHRYDIQHSKLQSDFLQDHIEIIPANVIDKTKLNPAKPLHNYLTFNTFENWIDEMVVRYSSLSKSVIGVTYEERNLTVLKVSTSREYKPAIFVLGGEEARDWLSPAIILNFIYSLLHNPEKWSMLTDTYNLYFLPLFNPDGYHYTLVKNILWSKNRRKFALQNICPSPDKQEAVGVNIDRNWYFEQDGSSLEQSGKWKEECDSVYLGDKPLAEQETNSLSMYLNEIALDLMGFICIKGFRNLITLPYSNKGEYTNNHAILLDIITAASKTVEREMNVTYYCGETETFLCKVPKARFKSRLRT